MSTRIDEIIEKTLHTFEDLPFLLPQDLPSIALYMDQVTSLLEEKLSPTRRSQSDKLVTKTMINNYAKNKLLPPPDKKKYSRQHLLLLVLIYYFKSTLSMQDSKAVFETVSFDENLYSAVFENSEDMLDITSESIDRFVRLAEKKFAETENQEKEQLQLFSLICELIMDIYVKKRLIEQLIDDLC